MWRTSWILDLTGYYRRFVRNYGIIARPLTDLTKKDAFFCTLKVEEAFKQLKQVLTSVPVLRLPDFNQQFNVECDASTDGMGAILLQQGHPLGYFSKGFSSPNRIKSTYDRELLAFLLYKNGDITYWADIFWWKQTIVAWNISWISGYRPQNSSVYWWYSYSLTSLLCIRRAVRMKVLIRFPADHNMLSFLALAMPIPLDFTTLREAL